MAFPRPDTPHIRIPLGLAYETLDIVRSALDGLGTITLASAAGAVRRGVDLLDVAQFVVGTTEPQSVFARLRAHDSDIEVVLEEPSRLELRVGRVPVEIECVPPESAEARLLYLTAHPAHLDALHARAHARGLDLSADGVVGPDGARLASAEPEIYASLGLPFIAPELRNGDDEIRTAESGRLPTLLEVSDIRGDLHMHSLWSDGRDPIEAMVVSAMGLGYEYIAITDHSQSSRATRNLTLDGVERQADEIASLRADYPQIAILHGCEVDILEDGSLDFPDRVLERLDIVLASLHEPFDHDADMLLRRYERAMRHPLVSIITHPTNRLVPHREGYDLDYDRLFALALETGTLLEIDGAPSHLDLDASLARRAVDAGVDVTVDSDGHRAAMLGRHMQLGVVTARRGRVEPRHVLNTRPLSDVRARIASKRTRAR